MQHGIIRHFLKCFTFIHQTFIRIFIIQIRITQRNARFFFIAESSVYISECVWLKMFHFPVQSPLAARPEPLLSALRPPRFSLLLDLAGCLDSPWPNDHPSCTVCIWCILSSRDHRCCKSNNPVFQSSFQPRSNIFHLVFLLFPLPSADGAAQRGFPRPRDSLS